MTIDELEVVLAQAKRERSDADMPVLVSNPYGAWQRIYDAVVAPNGQVIIIPEDHLAPNGQVIIIPEDQ